ncbi:bifunctional DNA-formamidopyrimidine glycosylase/DNA-(apurinic or apyrimidinic site) lyase, partial [Patescibacteria group bacterium]|nr:bifunctional DNA-formamidopyrimidine glycosylase/DNA-(apurinic or apyrimidinic site) lyase [Patescibacteria group bacterium]
MPELPEVEIIKRELNQKVVGKVIVGVEYDTPKMLGPSPEVFREGVVGKSIKEIRRRAKLLLFELSPRGFITCHLKLAGRLLFRSKKDQVDDFVHITLLFNDETELRFADARKFGYMHYLVDEASVAKVLSVYGPELSGDLSPGEFYEILQATKRKIKVLLMDQKKIAGIGNIYANDALWLTSVHPARPANSLTKEEATCLLRSLQEVLEEGLEDEGASDQWYRHTDGSKGHYQEHFKVYGRTGERCLRCGAEIQYSKLAGRGTFW